MTITQHGVNSNQMLIVHEKDEWRSFMKKQTKLIAILLSGLLIVSLITTYVVYGDLFNNCIDRYRSIKINAEGVLLLENQEYEDALIKFESAQTLDERNIEAQYNYAKTLTILISIDHSYFEMENIVFNQLIEVVETNAEYKNRVEKDIGFDYLRKDFRYYMMLDYDTENESDLRTMLTQMSWYIWGWGLVDIYGMIEFNNDGIFNLTYKTPEAIDYLSGSQDVYSYSGTYKIENETIYLTLKNPMLRKRTIDPDILSNTTQFDDIMSIKLVLTSDGSLESDIFDYLFYWQYPSNG